MIRKIKELDDGRDVCRINGGLTKVLRHGAHNTEATKICILLVSRYDRITWSVVE